MNTNTETKNSLVTRILGEAVVRIEISYKGRSEGITTWSVYLRKYNDKLWFRYKSESNELPQPEELLSWITKIDPGTFDEFCAETNISTDSRKGKKEWDEHRRQYIQMIRLFTPNQLQELRSLDN